jgi:hypothetical protein
MINHVIRRSDEASEVSVRKAAAGGCAHLKQDRLAKRVVDDKGRISGEEDLPVWFTEPL